MLFAPAADPVPDAGFSAAVAARIARESRRRRMLLGAAGLTGLVVAAEPLWDLAHLLGVLAARAGAVTTLLDGPALFAAGLLALAVPALLQLLDV